jgi:predicted dehydrogenase
VLLTYPQAESIPDGTIAFRPVLQRGKTPTVSDDSAVRLGVLGAGAFAQTTLLPALKEIDGASLIGVCNATGPRSRSAAAKFGFSYCATSDNDLLSDPNINAMLIATRHNMHATQVLAAIIAQKAVFCEKPLCLTESELALIVRAMSRASDDSANVPLLMVGFNRRFAPMAVELKEFLSRVHEPLSMHYRVNAGYIPADHWVNDPDQGGGRILGEVCHFVDFLCFLADAAPV